jgi:hypothetical protein
MNEPDRSHRPEGTSGESPRRPPHELALRGWLSGLRRRWRLLTGLGVAARAGAAVAVLLLGAWLAERAAAPVGATLVLLFAATVALAIAIVALLSRPLWTPPSDRQLARLAEERDPSLDDVLVTATERLEATERGPFDGFVVKSAADKLQGLEHSGVIDRDTMRRAALFATVGAVLLLTGAGAVRQPAWRAWQTARLFIAPPRLTLVVEPGDARVVVGSPLRIVARLEGLPDGATPELPRVHLSGVQASGGQTPVVAQTAGASSSGLLSMRQEGQSYVAEIASIDRSLRYRVTSGSITSREFQIAALEPARVKRIDIEYEFPAFTKLAPRRDEDSGDVYGPAGTAVRLRVQTDKPVVGGALALREGAPIALTPSNTDTELTGTFTLKEDGAYRVGLRDQDGLSSKGDTEYFIRIMDDRPPDVRVMRPGGDRQVTRLEEIVVEARADDDHGIGSLELVYAVRGGKERVVPLHRGPASPKGGSTSASVTGAHTLYVEEMDVQPGDFITYFARARDVSRGKPSTEARSDIFFLEVRPFNEEFFAAQSQAGMMGGGGAAADLLESQKEIIVATWKLQRRAMAGQSAQDVKAVGKAQGELRARATAMAAQMARPASRRRPVPGQPPAPVGPPEENPLQKAAVAMGLAETSLNGLQPAKAVPHEMAAYNELLKLQAEITRRQVQRQRGGGGGGGRTGNQDLSALFDEELLRQQDNNYENKDRAAGAEQAQSAEDSSLDKLKELARRQDEIAQRQRELARARASLPQEEMKRQLERLTREQEQLRRDTEALSQQMASRQSGSQQSQQSGSQQSGSQQGGQQASSGQSGQSQSGQGQSGQGQPGQSQAGQTQSGEQSGQQQSASNQAGQSREQSDRLRKAAEQMANASRELSRADLDEARQRTDQTLAQLRELERRMSGEAVPDEGRRAFGEMQLEAQQLAESQRRVASETRRIQKAGAASTTAAGASRSSAQTGDQEQGRAASSDALRRLAAEQERLAQRMAALEQRLRGVSKTTGGEEATRAATAARDELAKRRLADEMRKMASALREAGQAGERAGASQPRGQLQADQVDALAQDASRVAERLGASVAGNRESQQIADQLARLRGARERMNDIEQRLRDAMRQGGDPSGGRPGSQQGEGARPGSGQQGSQQASSGTQPGNQQAGNQQGNPQSGSSQAGGAQNGGSQSGGGQSGSPSQGGSQAGAQAGGQRGGAGGGGGGNGDIARLQAEYNNALRETRELMDGLGRQGGGSQNGGGSTPEGHEFSRSAPGTEAFKQDYSRWDVLTKDVNLALEQVEASLAQRLSERAAKDRVHAGGDDRAPAQYSESVSRYYRSLAKKPTP